MTSVRLDEHEHGKNNNLNLIRLILASLVILSHCWILLGGVETEPLYRLTGNLDLGGVSVIGFFFISGYLILKSGLRWSSPQHYVAARALRIFPALLLSVVLCAVVLGPFATKLSIPDYVLNPLTRQFFWQATLHKVHLALPGVFQDGRRLQEVNAPLWTLPTEWTMYTTVMTICLLHKWRFSLDRSAWRPARQSFSPSCLRCR
ncbi:Acyltransferase family protein [Granulicella rosea]|uniref:Acyltransferase family protein n=1 Tax=Granulicella rosea TaxID=474952 RepID=A0A239IIB9_9BACT|nr:acyltransferase family protein [Granulicella rosea]SNS93305.1 Acyltransferase family protein [Granulicella rosea]